MSDDDWSPIGLTDSLQEAPRAYRANNPDNIKTRHIETTTLEWLDKDTIRYAADVWVRASSVEQHEPKTRKPKVGDRIHYVLAPGVHEINTVQSIAADGDVFLRIGSERSAYQTLIRTRYSEDPKPGTWHFPEDEA